MQHTRRLENLFLTLFVAGALVAVDAPAATLHTDTFDGGMTLGWVGGGNVTGQTDGGPAGDGDGFLRIPPRVNLAAHISNALWTGDFTAIGATAITADMMNAPGSSPLEIRVVLFGPDSLGNRWTSSTPASIPADGVWRPYSFSLAEADLSFVGGAGTFQEMMADVEQVMFRHDPGGPDYGGTSVSATLAIDNVQLAGPTQSPPGDYSGDGVVDQNDYQAWVDAFGTVGDSPADGNGDGVVGAADYVFWRNLFESDGSGNGSTHHAIPEPAALLLLVAGGFLVAIRR